MSKTLLIRCGEDNRMVLNLENLFPRTKTWLHQFERLVLRYDSQRDKTVDELIDYLTTVVIPGLPEAARKLDAEIETAAQCVAQTTPGSPERKNAVYHLQTLNNKKNGGRDIAPSLQ